MYIYIRHTMPVLNKLLEPLYAPPIPPIPREKISKKIKNKEASLAGPYADQAVTASLDHVTFLDADVIDDGGRAPVLRLRDAGAAVPLPRLHLIVHLDHVLAGRAGDPPAVEHHACDWVFVRVGVEDGSCAEIPYLIYG